MALLKDLWHFNQKIKPSLFYNEFSSLNDFFDTSLAEPSKLLEIQKKQLYANYNQKESYQHLNNFITELLGDKQGTEEDLFAQLINGINEGLDEFRSNMNKINKNWIKEKEKYYNKLDKIIEQISFLVNQQSEIKGINPPSIQPIKNAIAYHNKSDFIKEKGQYLEDLGAWIMQMAGLSGFSTGSWQAKDKFFGEEAQASIIEDAMGLLLNGNQKLSGGNKNFLEIKIQKYNKANASKKKQLDKNLQDWINSIKELNGVTALEGKVRINSNISSPEDFVNLIRLIEQNTPSAKVNFSISFSDNLYQKIQKLSVNIQGKSNIERHLANEGNRSLYHMDFNDKYYNQLLSFSKTSPVVKNTAVSLKEQKAKYEEFALYVNYNLSHNINNTVYGRNEFYLTKEGFTNLATLMEKRGFYIRIKDTVLSYQEFLNNSFKTIYNN